MSRVRILNLPNDCTEEQLRDFILKGLPSDAPPVEITDVVIKRTKPLLRAAERGSWSVGRRQPCLATIRMAFVGFRFSSSGRFVVQYFHNSYFRSSRIHVEIAKGINDPELMAGMQKRVRFEEQRCSHKTDSFPFVYTAKHLRDKGAHAECSSGDTKDTLSMMEKTRGEARDPTNSETHVPHLADSRKEAFVDERAGAATGPSWAAEVLVPSSSEALATATKPDGNDRSYTGEGDLVLGDSREVNEEKEQRALERQQALGDVSDMDFLEKLAAPDESSPTSETTTVGKQLECGADKSVLVHTEFDGADKPAEGLHNNEHLTHASKLSCAGVHDADTEADIARQTRRVRIANVPYTATEEDIKQFASSLVGPVEAVHIPLTRDTRQSKGAAFVRFCNGKDAIRALVVCDGAIFMGRLLRVGAATEDPYGERVMEREARRAVGVPAGPGGSTGIHPRSIPFKIRNEVERRQHSANPLNRAVSWNPTYMNAHTAVDTMAQRLGVQAEDIVAVTCKGAAVRAAIAEAHLTNEVRQVFGDEGINFALVEFSQQNLLKPRSNTTILVKNLNLKHPQDASDLSQFFIKFGVLEAAVFASSGAFALFRYLHPQNARIAFTRLSFKLFKNAPLFLEWAQVGTIVEDATDGEVGGETEVERGGSNKPGAASEEVSGTVAAGTTASDGQSLSSKTTMYTLFITNIPFTATEDSLRDFLVDTCPHLAKCPTELIQRLVHQRELGRAFLTVPDARIFAHCLRKLNGSTFDGRLLSCVASKRPSLIHRRSQTDGTESYRNAENGVEGSNENAEKDDELDLSKARSVIRPHGTGYGNKGDSGSKVPPGCDPCKIIVKNLPFEAIEKDVRDLFSAFSEVRSVRMPRKSNNFTSHRENNHRGFAFVEFMSEAEAVRAFMLDSTHLYGRHLVLQYARLE